MLINDIHSSEWGASLSEKLVTPASEEAVRQGKVLLYTNHVPKRLYMKILIEGYNRLTVEKYASSLALQFKKEFTIQTDNSTSIYKCMPATPAMEETGFNTMQYMTIETECIEYEEETSITSSSTSFNINADGNIEAPCTIELLPSKDIAKVMLTGLSSDPIYLNDLKAGKLLIVNGEEGEVEEAGVSSYEKFDGWEFPKIQAGVNLIQLNEEGITITVRYKARWN